jgi:hypothetical protein
MTARKPPWSHCECGCGRHVNPLARGARLSVECAERRRLEQKRAWNQRQKERDKARKSLAPNEHRVSAQFEPVKARHQHICGTCAGMPSARALDRLDDWRRPIGVLAEDRRVVCRECEQPYGDDPPLKRCSVLGSSAGTAVRAAAIHGLAADPKCGRPSRAKVAS